MHFSISKTLAALLFVAATTVACFHQDTGALSRAPAAFLVFSGETSNALVSVDSRPFELNGDNAKNHFELSPGKHRVRVTRQGQVVVDRELLLSDGQTMEVSIP